MGFLNDASQIFGGTKDPYDNDLERNFDAEFGAGPRLDIAGSNQGPVDVANILQSTKVNPVRSVKPRASALEIIGKIGDAAAILGGSAPLYSYFNDRDRSLAKEDRELSMAERLDPLRLRKAELEITGAENEIAGGSIRDRLAQALGGFSLMDGATPEQWGELAQATGLPAQEIERIGAFIQQNPKMAAPLAQAMGYKPPQQGSPSKTESDLAILQARDPSGQLAQQYIERLATGVEEMSPYQQEQIRLRRDGLSATERWRRSPNNPANRRADAAETKANGKDAAPDFSGARDTLGALRQAGADLQAAGGMSTKKDSPLKSIDVMARENIPGYERILAGDSFEARERVSGLITQGVMSIAPLLTGTKLGGKNFDAAKEIETWKQAFSSAKSAEAFNSTMQRYERRINELERAASRPATPAATPRRGNAPAPRTRGGNNAPAKRRKYNPATGRIE